MKLRLISIGFAVVALSQCQVVTAPIKAVGGIATQTVETTGDVVTAPFDAVGRSR
jgi:hypothetical protein